MKKKDTKKPTRATRSSADFVAEFVEITGLRPAFDEEYQRELERLIGYLGEHDLRALLERRCEFLARVNWKFRLNAGPLGKFYRDAAREGFTFHYHQKCQIQRAFDLRDRGVLVSVLDGRGVPKDVQHRLVKQFNPVDESRTLSHLRSECREPTKLRKEKGERDIEGEIVKAQFSAFMWVSLPQKEMHRFFDPGSAMTGTASHSGNNSTLVHRTFSGSHDGLVGGSWVQEYRLQ